MSRRSLSEHKTQTNNNSAVDVRNPDPTTTVWSLLQKGYKKEQQITQTLQGCIYTAEIKNSFNIDFGHKNNNNNIIRHNKRYAVVKQSSKVLHRMQKAIGKKGEVLKNIQENIIREAQIMKSLNEKQNVPASMILFLDFFEDASCYYLVMENAGKPLFQFVVDQHAMLKNGKLSILQWQKQTQFMFAQMVHFHGWMHCHNFCNLDVSMENILISNSCYLDASNGTLNNCDIKFIDFGLSEYFPSGNFQCRKFVGKTYYKAPKVYAAKEAFDGRKADIWSLGVILFMMVFGCRPYNKPRMDDESFNLISKSEIVRLIQKREPKKVEYCNIYQLDMLLKLLDVNEDTRPLAQQLLGHMWLHKFFQFTSSSSSSSSSQAPAQAPAATISVAPNNNNNNISHSGSISPQSLPQQTMLTTNNSNSVSLLSSMSSMSSFSPYSVVQHNRSNQPNN